MERYRVSLTMPVRYFAPSLAAARHPCGRRRGLLRVVGRLLLQIVRRSSAGRRRCLQRLDLPVGGVEFLLMVRGEFCDRLLQEVDIALQATGPPLHGLFDGADFDAGNVLRMNARRQGCHQQRGNQLILVVRAIIKSSLKMRSQHQELLSRQFARSRRVHPSDTTLIPHSGVVLSLLTEDGFSREPQTGFAGRGSGD